MGVRSGSGWATAGSGSDAGFSSGSGVRRRSSPLNSEVVNWVGVRGGDGKCSSGSVVMAESRGSVKVVETGEKGSGSKAGTLVAGSELEKGLWSSWGE